MFDKPKNLYVGVIALEKTKTTDGRIVVLGALRWSLPVPVFMIGYGSVPTEVVGELVDINRQGQYIIGRAYVNDPRRVLPCGVDLDQINVTTWRADVTDASDLQIDSAELRALTIYYRYDEIPAWPGCALVRV